MKLSNIFPLLVALLFISQEQNAILSLNASGSPGYYQDGDFIIGGLFSLRVTDGDTRNTNGTEYQMEFTKHYQHLLAMIFAVEEINKNLNLLFNMPLGFYLFSVDYIEMKAMESSLSLLSGQSPPVPSYNCRPEKGDKLVAVIGGISTAISTQISRVLSLYSVPQVNAKFYYDIRGEMFLQDMTQEMNNNGLCISFAERISEFPVKDTVNRQLFIERLTTTNVNIAFGDMYSLLRFVYNIYCSTPFGNIWVTTSDWGVTTLPFEQSLSYTYFGGGLSFSFHKEEIPGFKDFLRTVQPAKYPHDIFIQDHGIKTLGRCEQNGTLETRTLHVWDMSTLPQSYNVYAAVYVIAQALHKVLSLTVEDESLDKDAYVTPHPWHLHPFLQKSQLERSSGKQKISSERISKTKLDIFNYQPFLNGTKAQVKVGEFIFESHKAPRFSLNDQLIMWGEHHIETPFAICSPSCQLGFRKTALEGKSFCCFDCIPCPNGEIANKMDMDQCVKCPEDQYPNMQRNQCLPKVMIFLSHEDTLGAVLGCVAISLSVLTALILANNRNLNYILISLIFCFSCSLMFIGLPSPFTCILRQTFFGVVFAIAVSAVLAKTFIVVVAFKSIKPGNSMQMWMVTRFSNAVVCSCSLIQVCICTVWLGTSPPFPDTDTHSEFGQIILQCNEGSTVAFYCVLGYLGFLALLVLAFLARRLADSFNEAKMITFSMLVFGSVWISFIPTYLSTKGKTMVALEIFAILSSSAGLLGCIFLPKCYVILLRSDNNSRKNLLE
uniref:Vomeronasal type-2 receptor 26-like n=1 Tax=Chinchilla lanigera TaxID=34839 RepID=A0A8C2VTW1_CHILA